MKKKIIGLDIDGVIADFVGGFYAHFKKNRPYQIARWEDAFINRKFRAIRKDEDFWMGLLPCVDPSILKDREFDLYLTSRPISSEISEKWLAKWGFPNKPVHTVSHSKVAKIKELGVTHFLDDKPMNYLELNTFTDCECYLMDQDYNRHLETQKRISTLTEFFTTMEHI